MKHETWYIPLVTLNSHIGIHAENSGGVYLMACDRVRGIMIISLFVHFNYDFIRTERVTENDDCWAQCIRVGIRRIMFINNGILP